MSHQSNINYNQMDKNLMLTSSYQITPESRFQAEVTLSLGKGLFSDSSWFHVKVLLVNEEQCNKELFAPLGQIIVNYETGIQGTANKDHNWLKCVRQGWLLLDIG